MKVVIVGRTGQDVFESLGGPPGNVPPDLRPQGDVPAAVLLRSDPGGAPLLLLASAGFVLWIGEQFENRGDTQLSVIATWLNPEMHGRRTVVGYRPDDAVDWPAEEYVFDAPGNVNLTLRLRDLGVLEVVREYSPGATVVGRWLLATALFTAPSGPVWDESWAEPADPLRSAWRREHPLPGFAPSKEAPR